MRIRVATPADVPLLFQLMERAVTGLLPAWLSPAQVEASRSIMGLDSQLILDGSYLIAELDGCAAGCGGWSGRATLFGGDHSHGLHNPRPLDPKTAPTRIRAMYTDPAFARRGVGRAILAACEDAARAAGFTRAELMATAAGEPLYRACGYAGLERLDYAVGEVSIPLVRMGKKL
jgi:GNAT superfamily N-acetyltransferase